MCIVKVLIDEVKIINTDKIGHIFAQKLNINNPHDQNSSFFFLIIPQDLSKSS